MRRTPGGSRLESRRIGRLLVRLALGPGEVTDSILNDLEEEYRERVLAHPRTAARWYRQQVMSVATRGALARVRGRGWQRRVTGAAPRWEAEVGTHAVESVSQDIREALRAVGRAPRYALAVILTFGLAVGANVAVFSMVNGVLLRPLPYPESGQLVSVTRVFPASGSVAGAVSYPDFTDWQARASDLALAAAYTPTGATYYGGEFPERLAGISTTPDLFRVLRMKAALGRTFAPGEARPGDRFVILSDALWREQFGSDPDIVGRQIRLGSAGSTVLGIMPKDFTFPDGDAQFWTPLPASSFLERRGMGFLNVVARIADAHESKQVEARLKEVAATIDAAEGRDDGRTLAVVPLKDSMVGDRSLLFLVLLGAVGLVLAIACANIASLTLSRSVNRSREFAVRVALGAGRGRLARLLLWESLLLGVAGTAWGVLLAFGLLDVILAMAPPEIPRLRDVSLDGVVLLFAVGITLLSVFLFGMFPALRSSNLALDRLHGQGRGTTGNRAHHRAQGVLVVAQVAVAMVLLAGAGLLTNSFARMTAVHTGFEPDRVLSMVVQLPASRYSSPEAQEQFYRNLNEALRRLPDVEASGTTQDLPFSLSTMRMDYEWDGFPLPDEDRPVAEVEVVGEEYFRTMGIPVVLGRPFGPQDRPDGPRAVVVNETLARRQWPDENPIGKRMTFEGAGDDPQERAWFTVVGVVSPVVRNGLDNERQEEMYLRRGQASNQFDFMSALSPYLVVRAGGDPMSLVSGVRRVIRSLDPQVPVSNIESLSRRIDATLVEPRFRLLVIGSFALLAAAVATFGLFSLMTFVVSSRTKEIGVRMALGASPGAVRGSVVARALRLTGAGVLIGTALTMAGTRFVAGFLFRVTPHDPLTLAAVASGLVLIGCVAGLVPAAQAGRIDPVRSLARE